MTAYTLPLALYVPGRITLLGLYLVLVVFPALLACTVLSRIPPQHRKQSPGLAFLLLVPFFSLIWMFFVHPKVAQSLQRYFAAQGDSSHGDCGAGLALWACLCTLGSLIPFFGILSGLVAVVLLSLFYLKAFALSSLIPK